MAITLDNTSQGFVSTSGPLTFNHTIGSGSNRLLVISFAIETSSAPVTGLSVTYNGVSCTVVRTDASGTSGYALTTGIAYMDEANLPAAGTYQVSISMTNTGTDNINGGAVSVFDAGQSGPEANNGQGNATSGSSVQTSITTSTNGAWCFDAVGSGNAITFTVQDAEQTQRWEVTASSSGGAGSTEEVATAGTEDLGWTFDATSNRDAHSVAAWPPASVTTYKLEGITKDNSGNPLGSCECYLLKDNGDDTYDFIDQQTSNATTGAYSFTGLTDNDSAYQVVAWKDDTPHVYDCTDHVLTPVVE